MIAEPTDAQRKAILADPAKFLKGFEPLPKEVGLDMTILRQNLPGGKEK